MRLPSFLYVLLDFVVDANHEEKAYDEQEHYEKSFVTFFACVAKTAGVEAATKVAQLLV